MNTPKNVSMVVLRRKNELDARVKESSYGKIAKELNVNKGVLWKFLNTEYIPTNKEILRKLGLPEPAIIFQKRNKKGQYESF